MSYLVLSSDNPSVEATSKKYASLSSSTTLATYEAQTLIELLSNTLHGRAKEGTGGYSGATFSLKSVLYALKCILSEPKNRLVFAATYWGSQACPLNVLLLKAVARYSLLSTAENSNMDAEAAEHALLCLYYMTLYGLDDAAIGYPLPYLVGNVTSAFLPTAFGDYGKLDAKSVLAKVLASYLSKGDDATTNKGRYAANQILLRLSYLRFEGSVAALVSG